VLVVIPCLNEQSYVGSVISAALRDPARDRLTVVVVDGGSTDGTCQIVSEIAARDPRLRLIPNPARIQSIGINVAARRFGKGHRWLVRMDAHAEYPDNYISTLLCEAERIKATSVVVAMNARGVGCLQRAAATAQNSILGAGGSPHRSNGVEGFVDHGHHALIDLRKFLSLRGYDETQTHNEDAEFDVRLTQAGGRIWLTRATQMIYFPRASARDLLLQYRNYGRGRAITMLRHRMRPKTRQLIPAAIAPCVLLTAFAPFHLVLAFPTGIWLAACAVFGLFLGMKERSRCALAAACAAPIMHLGWSLGFWAALLEHVVSTPASHNRAATASFR
jgi:succinoglycan biosynthesis protein ExoA